MNSATVVAYTGALLDAVSRGYPLGNGYRVHLPWLMRFSAPDGDSPFGRGGVNGYAYCVADPINNTDPSGRFTETGMDIALDALTSTRPLQALSADEIDGELNALHPAHPAAEPAQGAAHAAPETPGAGPTAARANRRAPRRRRRRPYPGAMVPSTPPLWLDALPTDHAGYTRAITEAWHLGQLRVAPYDNEESTLIAQWWPHIVLEGQPLDIRDKRLAEFMKNGYAFSRVNNVVDPDVPFELKVDRPHPRSLLINVALGGPVPGPDGFRIIRLKPSYSLSRFPKRMYTRYFENALDNLITSLY